MVLDLNRISTEKNTSEPAIPAFLQTYSELLRNLKDVFNARETGRCNLSTISIHVTAMKDFVIRTGGLKAAELLAEYEKYSAIGDCTACRRLEKSIIGELSVFKECWLSMLC